MGRRARIASYGSSDYVEDELGTTAPGEDPVTQTALCGVCDSFICALRPDGMWRLPSLKRPGSAGLIQSWEREPGGKRSFRVGCQACGHVTLITVQLPSIYYAAIPLAPADATRTRRGYDG